MKRNDRKDRLLRELDQRLDCLICLAWATRHQVLEHARARLTATKIEAYIEDRVVFLQRWIASEDHPVFLGVCRELGRIRTRDELQRRLGVYSPDASSWLDAAERSSMDKPRRLFCAANAWALSLVGASPEEEAASVYFLSSALLWIGRSEAAVWLLEGHLGLTGADYADPAALGKHLRTKTDGLTPGNAALLMDTLADALWRTGRWAEARSVLERRLGLTGADYADTVALGKHLRATTEGLAPDATALLVIKLAQALRRTGRWANAVSLLEGHLGLTGADYADPAALGEYMRTTTEGLAPDTTALLMFTLADALVLIGRWAVAGSLLEGHLGLTGADYADPAALGKHLRTTTEGLPPDATAVLVSKLADALVLTGRWANAVSLLEGHLGLTGADYADPAALGKHLRATTEGVAPDNAADLMRLLAQALRRTGRWANAVSLLEGHLGLTGAHYADPLALGKHLRATTEGLRPDTTALLMDTLADALVLTGRRAEARSVLEGHLGLTGAHYADPAALGKHLRTTTEGLAPDNAALLVIKLAQALRRTGRWANAVSLLEGHLGLTGAHYADPAALGEHLRTTTEGVAPDNAAILVYQLVDLLQVIGQTDKVACLLDAYLTAVCPLDDALKLDPAILVELLQSWFSWFGSRVPPRAQGTARKAVAYLRQVIQRPGTTLDDRKRFLELARGLRLTLGELAHHWADLAADAGEARQWHLTAQLWDAELGQRVLLERFLLGRILHAGDDGACEPAPRWAFPGHEPSDTNPPDTLKTMAAFDALADGGAALTEVQAPPLATVGTRPSWLDEAERRVNQGLDEPALARALGPSTLLLRLSLSRLDKRFLWTATRSDGERLEMVAHGVGQPDDQSRLAWAVARHDLRIALAYLSQDVAQGILVRLRSAYDGGRLLTPERDGDSLHDETMDLAAQFKRNHEGFGCRFEAVCVPLVVPGPDLAGQWRATLKALLQTAERPMRGIDTLNAATVEFVQEVERVCDLSPLAGHLDTKLDVVVQADDVLHAVPVPHLEVAGRAMWQCVRSVRASLSVLLDGLQHQIEQERRDDVLVSRRLMTVTWVRPDDPVRPATQSLHQEQRALAGPARFGLEWRGAAEDPRAIPGTLFRGIDGGPLRALTVCGHGDEQRAGVLLAGPEDTDCLWSGQGRDLSGVEWLLLVSCSVGRVQGSSVRDVEGLCVELALHRCRSVLAAKWPVEGLQAATVANRVLEEYLELRRQFDDGQLGPDLSDARLRSLALNRARQHLGREYLNTLAAFELYGLG